MILSTSHEITPIGTKNEVSFVKKMRPFAGSVYDRFESNPKHKVIRVDLNQIQNILESIKA